MAVGSKSGTSLVPLENTHITIPSAIFFNTEDNHTSFGRKGLEEYRTGYEGRLLRSLKSVLGSELITETTQVGKRKLAFRDIIGMFIGHIKAQGEKYSGHELSNVVMGRPVHFVDGDDIADKRAQAELENIAKAQGFQHVHFEYEPLAAARDYESTITKEQIVLVFDIGGGTSDFSVVRLSPKAKKDRQSDILANEGIHIGGTNFDQKLSLETVMKDLGYQTSLKSGLEMPKTPYLELSTWHLINFLYTQKSISEMKSLLPLAEDRSAIERFIRIQEMHRGHEIAGKVEEAKIALSESKKHRIYLEDIDRGWSRDVTLQNLHTAINDEIGRIVDVAKKTVTNAGLKPNEINAIFMTGGSTGLPGFEIKIREAFGSSQIQYGDRFSSVAKGLGLAAADQFL